MSFRRVGGVAAVALAMLLWAACGQVYRPVVIPCSSGGVPGCPVETPPAAANFHAVFGLSANVPDYPGGAMQIDVAGDNIIAETPTSDASAPNLGDNPTYAAILPNDARVFVAGAGSIFSGETDTVSYFTPEFQTSGGSGFSGVSSINLPSQTSSISSVSESGSTVTVTLNTALTVDAGYAIVVAGVAIPNCIQPTCNPLAYNGTFALSSLDVTGTIITYTNSATGLAACGPTAVGGLCPSGATVSIPPQPVFLNSTQNTAMYVANYNTNSVFAINTTLNVVSNTASVGVSPVSLAETPNGLKLYVANQGDNTVSSLNTLDLSPNTLTVPTGTTLTTPVWVVARGDSQKVYVLTQGGGQLITIDTATDTVTSSITMGTGAAGANFIFFDPHLNRLYVTNPVTSMLYVFSDTGGISPTTSAVSDIPALLAAISFGDGSAACPAGCSPASVTALPDGTRFYVASYQTPSGCACVVPGLTVFNANNFALEYPAAPTLNPLTDPPFAASQNSVPLEAGCSSPVFPVLYAPSATRFRVFTTASADSTRVYVSICDAGVIAVINTTDGNINNSGGSGVPSDTVVTDLPAAFSNGAAQANGEPPNQNPIFLLTGQ